MIQTGTRTHPLKLETALAAANIPAGHMFTLLAGTYTGAYVCSLVGTEASPITIRADSGARVIIDSTTGLSFSGSSDVTFIGIEFTYSWPDGRDIYIKDTAPAYLAIVGTRLKFVNCIFHDIAQVAFFSNAISSTLYGCLLYNNGINGDDWNKLHNIYTQNNTNAGVKTIQNCIIMDGISQFGLHCYAESGSLKSYRILDNIISVPLALMGGLTPLDDVIISGNVVNHEFRLGYESSEGLQNAAEITDNLFLSVLKIWEPASNATTITGNTFAYKRPFMLYPADNAETATFTIDNNHFSNDDNDFRVYIYAEEYYGLAQWQAAYGQDANSDIVATSAEYDRTIIKANAYDANRWHMAIVNKASADSVTVDLSATTLQTGQAVRLRNCQDYYTDIVEATVSALYTITVDMRAAAHTVAAPVDMPDNAPASTFPTFGAFVVERVP